MSCKGEFGELGAPNHGVGDATGSCLDGFTLNVRHAYDPIGGQSKQAASSKVHILFLAESE